MKLAIRHPHPGEAAIPCASASPDWPPAAVGSTPARKDLSFADMLEEDLDAQPVPLYRDLGPLRDVPGRTRTVLDGLPSWAELLAGARPSRLYDEHVLRHRLPLRAVQLMSVDANVAAILAAVDAAPFVKHEHAVQMLLTPIAAMLAEVTL